jgi:hypothetical protein
MVHRNSIRQLHISLAAIFLSGLAAATGCDSKEAIRHYTAARPTETTATAAADNATPAAQNTAADAINSGEATDRMLVAIVPIDNQAHFFKVVGPISAVEKRKDEITEFFANLKVVDGRPTWTAPEGWKEDPASQMRSATLWIPTDDEPLEMAVTPLPWRGGQADLLSNVNRWRGQMQLPPIGPQQLSDGISEIKAGDATVTVVDMSGKFAGAGMMAPFAAGRAGAANRPAPRSAPELPPGHPPIDSSAGAPRDAPASAPAADVPKFEAPESWRSVPPASAFRKAEFAIGGDAQSASVTLIDFPTNAGPLMTDPLANINRWRGEIGLAKIEEDQLEKSSEIIEVGGNEAKYVRLIPDTSKPEESKIDKATLAAMVTSGEQIWFIKLFGNRDVVIAEEENFKAFLKSMQFADGGGERNGDE